jgi:hypothetical protein
MKTITMAAISICFSITLTSLAYGDDITTASPVPAAAAAKKTRGTVILGSLTDQYKPVAFDHKKHVAIAGDCGMCHHQHGNNSSLPCKECHAIQPALFRHSVTQSFMACKNCHTANDPAMPQMPGLKVAYHYQCFQCHRGMGNVGTDPHGCATMCHAKRDQKVGMKAHNK